MLSTNKYPITLWYGIPEEYILHADGSLAEERLDEMLDTGLNLITASYAPEINKKVLAFCEKHGVKCTVEDARITRAVKQENERQTLLEQVTKDYKDCPALFNYHVFDEPNSSDFAALRSVSDMLSALDPAHEPYINLFPNYASPEQLGTPTYEQYVERFVQEVRPTMISYDHYHFCKNEQLGSHTFENERDRMIYENAFLALERPGFFDNIEQIREASLRHGLPFMLIVLLLEHGPYRYLTEAELRWEVFQGLAYGASYLSYFTYWTPPYDDVWRCKEGMISEDGKRCRHYYDVQRINVDLQSIGDQLVGARSEAVFHIGECAEKVRPFVGYGEIERIDTASATVGFFDNGMFLLANKDYLAASEVRLTAKQPLLHFDKVSKEWKPLEDNTLVPAAGDGELLKISR